MFRDYINTKVIFSILLVLAIVLGLCYWPKYGWKISRFFVTRFGMPHYVTNGNSNTVAPGANATAKNTVENGVFEEGKHFQKLPVKITSSPIVQQFIAKDPGKIQVLAFFSYGCFWCQRLHPLVDQWRSKKPESVVFYRFPVNFHQGWDKLAKAYYMVEQMSRSQELDKEFFEAIHQKHSNLGDDKLLKEFFVKHGISEEKFNEMFNSFAVNRSYAQGNEIANAFQVTLSPIFIVNTPSGSYLLSAALAGSEQRVMETLEYLIKTTLTSNSQPVLQKQEPPTPKS